MGERVFVDRIEGERAVLVLGAEGRETVSVPRRLLPPETKEGAALELSLAPAPDDRTRNEVQTLMDDLFKDQKE